MRRRGRPVLGAVSGFFLGLFGAVDLLVFGAVELDSVVLIVLPVAGLVLGVVLALVARRVSSRPDELVAAAPTASPPPAPPHDAPPPDAPPPDAATGPATS
jgi:hypothetical protein